MCIESGTGHAVVAGDRCQGRWHSAAWPVLALALAGAAGVAQAQGQGPILSSPVPIAKPVQGGSASASAKGAAPAGGGAGVAPLGTGAGHYSPDSPFPALSKRSDVVPWSVLTAVKPQYNHEVRRMVPVFPPQVQAMHQTSVRIQGYMMPLTPGAQQAHFLVSSVPLTCAFCTPGGPESMVEVHAKVPVKYVLEGVVVQGRLQVLPDDPQGLFYRMTDAVLVK